MKIEHQPNPGEIRSRERRAIGRERGARRAAVPLAAPRPPDGVASRIDRHPTEVHRRFLQLLRAEARRVVGERKFFRAGGIGTPTLCRVSGLPVLSGVPLGTLVPNGTLARREVLPVFHAPIPNIISAPGTRPCASLLRHSRGIKRVMLLEQMSRRLHAQSSFAGTLRLILSDVIAMVGAELGTFQLVAGDRLLVVAHRGFSRPFLEFFREVSADAGCACGRALRTGSTVVIRDTEEDEEFAPYRAAARQGGYRGVVSQPLRARTSFLVGIVSTHFVNAHVPTRIEIETLRAYSTPAADHLCSLLGSEPLETKALSINRRLYDDAVLASV